MAMPKIAFFELENWEKEYLRKKLSGFELVFVDGKLNEKTAAKARDCGAVATFIYSKINSEVLERLPCIKLVATMSTGFDHIDVAQCNKRKIAVCNVPAYGNNTVAEHTFALLLAISRKLLPSVERARRGNFSLNGLRGFDLLGKTIGIVGTGRIGGHVARIAHGFGMKIIAFDAKKRADLQMKFHLQYAEKLDDLLAACDVVSLHLPLNEGTRHLINSKNISKFKKGAILLNTSRGGLVETHALVQGLKNGRIAYAGLDVLEEECFIKEEKQLLSEPFWKTCDLKTALENHALIESENVIVTPHNAFNSNEALTRILDTTVENLRQFFGGKPLLNAVN